VVGVADAGAETISLSPGPEQTFVVPSGVTRINVTAVGEKGQGFCLFGTCTTGFGEKVTATLTVTPGERLYADFTGGGAASGLAGRGGNAADLRTIPRLEAGSLSSRLVVAGGGGGEGEEEEGNYAGQGGSAGAGEGQPGFTASPIEGGAGAGGTQSHGGGGGGAGGGSAGEAGQLGQGGSGGAGTPAGDAGGGGGGYYGGGGGGGGQFAGAGGGGGSSFVAAGAEGVSYALNTIEAPAGITITYTGGTETVPFSASSAEQSFVVPVGVSRIKVVATGANGVDLCGCGAGMGEKVTASLAVTHGQTYFIDFGGAGSSNAGSGGNAADLRTVSRSQPGSLASRLIVAAGGGGSGIDEENSIGGRGGNAGATEGAGGGNGLTGAGGGGGTQSTGGTGGKGEADGETGQPGQGGRGGSDPEGDGGGGGGGYYGGGGGAGGLGGSAGGGGGSSFVVARAQEVSYASNGPKEQPGLSIIYKSASPPGVSITTPAEGAKYAVGQSVDASYSCTEGAEGPGLAAGSEGCAGTVADGAAINTSKSGEHHFTVTATSQDGLTASRTVTYTVAGAPSVSVTAPVEGARYSQGQTVDASYSCSEGAGGPGLKPGTEGCSGTVASGVAIDTATSGEHHFTVTATSQDGLTASRTVTYMVAGAPSVSVTAPVEGARYSQGQTVDASYSCSEGAGGPGLKPGTEGCSGTVASGAAIDTSTAGEQSFSVTATSSDGQSTTETVGYTVVAPPIFGRCLRVTGGRFLNPECTGVASRRGKYEWFPGPGPKPGFAVADASSSPILLETTGKKRLVCTGASGAGSITGLRTASLRLTFTGCSEGGEQCESTDVEGEIALAELEGTLAWSNKAKKILDLDLTAPGGSPGSYHCGSKTRLVLSTSGILLPVATNRPGVTAKDVFKESKGVQRPDALEGEPQLMFKELREKGGSSVEEGVGLRASLIQTYEEVGYEVDRSF